MEDNNDIVMSNEQLVKIMMKSLEQYSFTTIGSRMFVMDYALLGLEQDMNKVDNYIEKHKIMPGYSKFFSTLALLSCKQLMGGEKIKDEVLCFYNSLFDKIINNNLKDNYDAALGSLGLAQRDWQKKYIFKTYLMYLFLNDSEINPIFLSKINASIDDMVSICLVNKYLAIPEVMKKLIEMGKKPTQVFEKFKKYLVSNMGYLCIKYSDYKMKQLEKIKSSNYNIFAARMIEKDYPLLEVETNWYEFSSIFYLQDAIFSRTLREIADGGKNTDYIGNAFEKITYNEFIQCYTSVDVDSSGNKKIKCNPGTKQLELCDVLVEYNGFYLLIDCKSKEFIEDIFLTGSSEKTWLKKRIDQRINRINDTMNGKFVSFIPSGISRDKIFSIIALVDDGTFSKNAMLDEFYSGKMPAQELEYYKKNLHLIAYDDLLEAIDSDVNLIDVISRSINSNEFGNHLSLNIKANDKKSYCSKYNNWYKNAQNNILDFIDDNDILGLKEEK
ncbi:MAG: hypothetical protein MR357_01250 [Anaeroplasma sp.]|nr:hypothetical protein [Anaeroplasma sp.]